MTSPALQEIIAVLGCPAPGNPGQYLLERALATAGLDWRVVTCEVSPEGVAAALAGAAAMGFRGCVVSGPLRVPALAAVATASPAATFAGAVGLVDRGPGGLAGHMTDGRGVIEALRGHVDPASREVLILGAGPTARAVALEFALAGAMAIHVCDPRPERAAALVSDLAGVAETRVENLPWTDAIELPPGAGIVVRASAAAVELTGLRPDLFVADVSPGSPLPGRAQEAGACVVDGLEIRAVQAAIDFQALTGLETDADTLREALDEYLS